MIEQFVPLRDLRVLPDFIRLVDTRDDIPADQKNKVRPRWEVLNIVNETNLDLICISNTEKIHVYKLLNYGKFQYEQAKKARELAKKAREMARTVKEYYFSPGMAEHDFQIRLQHVKEALPDHDVKIGVKLNFKTRNQLPRGVSLNEAVKSSDFILNRVLQQLGDTVVPGKLVVGDKQVSVSLKLNQ